MVRRRLTLPISEPPGGTYNTLLSCWGPVLLSDNQRVSANVHSAYPPLDIGYRRIYFSFSSSTRISAMLE